MAGLEGDVWTLCTTVYCDGHDDRTGIVLCSTRLWAVAAKRRGSREEGAGRELSQGDPNGQRYVVERDGSHARYTRSSRTHRELGRAQELMNNWPGMHGIASASATVRGAACRTSWRSSCRGCGSAISGVMTDK